MRSVRCFCGATVYFPDVEGYDEKVCHNCGGRVTTKDSQDANNMIAIKFKYGQYKGERKSGVKNFQTEAEAQRFERWVQTNYPRSGQTWRLVG